MPGKMITKQQVRLYMESKQRGKTQKVAAAQAGFSERSARNIEKKEYGQPRRERHWRTRPDPFESVWNKDLVPLLEQSPGLQAITLLEHIQNKYEGQFPDKLLRTLQRRVRKWKALHGPEKEVIFRQNQPPGWQGLSDFTHMGKLSITIRGEKLDHMLYHYRLAFSGWEYAQVILGGESFSALAEGVQTALWLSGGAPETHRTDSLSAAFKNLSNCEKEDLTARYEELCAHYGMEATRNNKGKSHENGTIESSHRHLKTRIEQALMIRDSKDFDSLDSYRQFIRKLVHRANQRIYKEYLEEVSHLQPLPEIRTTDFTEQRAVVTRSSTIRIKEVIYSVPSRLIGMTLKIHIYDDRLECYVDSDLTLTLERKRKNKKHVKQIDYRHLIDSLMDKPTALFHYVYRDELFPTLAFKQTWEKLQEAHSKRKACREYVLILKEAAQEGREGQVSRYLEYELTKGRIPKSVEVTHLFKPVSSELPILQSTCIDLSVYDQLMQGGIR